MIKRLKYDTRNIPLYSDLYGNVFAFGGQSNIAGELGLTPDKSSGQFSSQFNFNLGKQVQSLASQGKPSGIGNFLSSGVGSAALGAVGAVGSELISGGLHSGIGDAVGTIGKAVPGPWGVAIQGAGALFNRAFGSSINKENVNAVQNNINALTSFKSNANNFDDLQSNIESAPTAMGFSNDFIGKDGLFSNKAAKKAAQLRQQQKEALKYADNTIVNNAGNIQQNQMSDLLGNYAAFGGKLSTNGADWDNNYTYIGNGGTHEQNPLTGVMMGVDENGTPNLVEEGEVVANNDYVFSNRLTVPKSMRDKYKLGKKKITYADAFKKLMKESDERPNDPLSNRAKDILIADLTQSQEETRWNNMSKKEKEAVLMQQMQAQQGMQEAPMGLEGNMNAYGGPLGNMFGGKGNKSQSLNGYGYNVGTPLNLDKTVNTADLYKAGSDYMAKYNYIRAHWNDPYVQNWVNKTFIPTVQEYNKSRGYTNPFNVDLESYVAGAHDGNYGGMHKGTEAFIIPNESNQPIASPTESYWGHTNNPQTGTYSEVDFTNPWAGLNNNTWLTKFNTINAPLQDVSKATGYSVPLYVNEKGEKETLLEAQKKQEASMAANRKTSKPKPTEEDDLPDYDNWLRYAPIMGASIGLAQNLFTSPDYSNAKTLEAHANRAGDYDTIAFNPIGDYLAYRPLDRQYALNQLNANAAANRRSMANLSGGNRGQAMAGILASDYNTGNQIGTLFRQAEESNQAQREKVATFNRATNMFNSEGIFKADAANQNARAQAMTRSFDLYGKAAAMRDAIDARRDQSIQANFSNIFDTLGAIGNEKVNRKTMKWMYDHDIFGNVGKKEPKVAKGACGGRIRRKKGLTI